MDSQHQHPVEPTQGSRVESTQAVTEDTAYHARLQALGITTTTQSTRAFSSDDSSYQARLRAACEPQSAQALTQDRAQADQKRAVQRSKLDNDIAELLPAGMSWLHLDDEEHQSTRLLILPSDPDLLHVESIRAIPGAADGVGPGAGTVMEANWMDFGFGSDEGGSMETVKVMAVVQSAHDVGCEVTVRSTDGNSPSLMFRLIFDPASEEVVLKNVAPSSLFKAKKDPGQAEFVVYPGTTANLLPGTWDLVSSEQLRRVSQVRLLVLRRRFFDASASSLPGPLGRKRSSPLPSSAAKKTRGQITPLRVHSLPTTDVTVSNTPQSDHHPLVNLPIGQTIHLIGSKASEEYSVTRLVELSDSRTSSVSRAVVTLFTQKQSVVAKVMKKRYGDTNSAVKMFLREAKIHHKVSSINMPTIVQLLGMDARLHAIYIEDIAAASLAHRVWRDGKDFFTGKPEDADRILRDMACALAYVHGKGVAHNDIKPGNILYSDRRGAVLIDFGLSSDSPHDALALGAAGTPWYIPPEYQAARENFAAEGRGLPGDVWALGVVMLYVLGRLRFPDKGREWVIAHLSELNSAKGKEAINKSTSWIGEVRARRAELSSSGTESLVRWMTHDRRHERATMRQILDALKTESEGGGELSPIGLA